MSRSPGSAVDTITVKGLLLESALRRFLPGAYRFCPDPDCDVVYFSTEGQTFTTTDLRVPVWQKLPFGDRPVCYCFGESEASIRSEFDATGTSTVIERIRDHISAERCACEVRNPRGACCLSDVTAAVERIEAERIDAKTRAMATARRESEVHFDLIVIGSGAGGFGAAIKANDLGAKTALVHAGLPLGGTCVNVGCVPSKTLLWAAEILHTATHHRIPGLELAVARLDFARIVQDELTLVQQLRDDKYAAVLRELKHVTLFEGRARFSDAHAVDVDGQTLTADRFVIATGSTATVPPIPGLQELGFLTHIEALRQERLPQSLVIIGAGAVGLEFSQLYARLGARVTVVQRGPTIGPRTEPLLAQRLIEVLEHEGIRFVWNADVLSVEQTGQRKRLTYRADGATATIDAEEILLAAGKTPNTDGLGLSAASVAVDERKAVRVNAALQTSAPQVYAVGDVAALPARVEMTAGREGSLAAENALTGSHKSIDYDTVPYTVFTDPQLAGVGLTKEAQMERLSACSCRTVSFEDVPKARILKRTEGLIKMAIHPQTRQVMGVHMLAPLAGDLVAHAMTIVRNHNTIDDVIDSLPMFPTLSESIKWVALAFTRDISKVSCCV